MTVGLSTLIDRWATKGCWEGWERRRRGGGGYTQESDKSGMTPAGEALVTWDVTFTYTADAAAVRRHGLDGVEVNN